MTRPSGEIFSILGTELQLAQAVIETFKEFQASGQEPGSEHWTTNEHGRARIDMLVRHAWGKITKFGEANCPFTRDCVVRLWWSYRKLGDEQKKAADAWAYGGQPGLF